MFAGSWNWGELVGAALCLLVITNLGLLAIRSLLGTFAAHTQFQLRERMLETELAYLQRLCQSQQTMVAGWEGVRKFRVDRKVIECVGTVSLFLSPHDGKPLPPFLAGQFLTVSVRLPGQSRPQVRCYSLSSAPDPNQYRITVRQVQNHRAASVSRYLVEEAGVGELLDITAPSGNFTLELAHRPVVMIAGGIGITPLLGMLQSVVEQAVPREVYLFYGVRNGHAHAFRKELETLASHANIHLHVFYSRPGKTDRASQAYDHTGHITVAKLRELLPSNNFTFLFCGPAAMIRDMRRGLSDWGVPNEDLKFEAFGASTAAVKPRRDHTSELSPATVRFDRSGKTLVWDGTQSSILQLAEAQGVPLDCGCCAGSCGTCVLAVKSGTVIHPEEANAHPPMGTCLACIAIPDGDIVLDA